MFGNFYDFFFVSYTQFLLGRFAGTYGIGCFKDMVFSTFVLKVHRFENVESQVIFNLVAVNS